MKPWKEAVRAGAIALAVLLLAGVGAQALEPKESSSCLDQQEFFKPELYISSSQVPIEQIVSRLPNQAAWQRYLAEQKELELATGTAGVPQLLSRGFIDPRSGAATSLIGAFPLIPGRGAGNRIELATLSERLGRDVEQVDAAAVSEAVASFIVDHAGLLGIDLKQLGKMRTVDVSPELWQVSIPQTYKGIPVRYGRLAATLNNGNLVIIGTETWGNVKGLDTRPRITAQQALSAGYARVGGASAMDDILVRPTLEIIPVAAGAGDGGYKGPVGTGYKHLLVWTFQFQRQPDDAIWETIVDAHSGEVLAFQDVNHYVTKQITGGVYPLTNTEICPTPGTCGTLQTGWPMPFADTALASPNNFTNSAGLFDWTSGTVTTTLTGRYVDIVDTCGAVGNSSTTGDLNLGGTNGQHDCTSAGGSTGNTSASRTAFYEVNKLAEMARGWLPANTWLQSRLTTNVNINNTCNAFWNGSTVNFYRSGGGCRNTGEIAGVFDHEWGHGLDDNDAAGALSNSSEGYADIAAIYRLQTSCVGHGFFSTSDKGCGNTADGTGFNANEAQQGASHCDLDCSGVRDADWDKHADHAPDTPLGFVCTSCLTGTGPCGRQVHCAAAPARQAAWDLVARDLRSAPFNYDSQTAFVIANRLFYQGSGNIGSWHSCTCGGTATGCGSTNGYMQWLTADDDNGNLNDGTPHMTAIFNAFNRHGIACTTPAAVNSGCAAGPTGTATLSATPGNNQAALSWGTVSGATRYWVFRSEGHAGCDFGKTKIGEVTGTTFTDTQVANGRNYYYNVVAAGASNACTGPVSNCLTVTPAASVTPDFTVSCSPSGLSVAQGANGSSTCTVTSTNGFNSAVALSCTGLPAGVTCGFVPSSVTPPANGSTTSALTISVAGSTTPGAYNISAQGVSGATTRTSPIALTVTGPGPVTVFFDNFETSLGWTTNPNATDTATTGQWERGDPEATTSSGAKQLGTTVSGTNDLVTGRLAGASAGDFDIDGGVTSIQSPAITLPATGTLTLTFSYYLANGSNSSTADFLRIFVVGGTTTQVFEKLGAAVNVNGVWASGSANISAFAGQSVRIRIEAADASTASLVEAGVDDVKITQQ
jgi:hypothetical protein